MLEFQPIRSKIVANVPSGEAPNKLAAAPSAPSFAGLLAESHRMQAAAWAEPSTPENSDSTLNPFPSYYRWMSQLTSILPSGAGDSTATSMLADTVSGVRESAVSTVAPAPVPEPNRKDISQWVADAADRHDIPRDFFSKLIRRESALDPGAVSPKGAMGLGQLMPETARELGLRVTGKDDQGAGSVWDPASNLEASARYLKKLHRHFSGRGAEGVEAWNLAAASYNAGIGNIEKALKRVAGDGNPTWERVASVLPQVTGAASRETIAYVTHLAG
jgi:soluble lytic murein transglycosylase-like protein